MTYARLLLILLVYFVLPRSPVAALELVRDDIGPYKWEGASYPAVGILTGSGRLGSPADEHVETAYRDRDRKIGVRVTVSYYADPSWVLHEFIGGRCRAASTVVGEAGKRRVEYIGRGLENVYGHAMWASGDSTLVSIEFSRQGADSELALPTEVIDAYLALYPSTLDESLLDTRAHCKAWIPREMQRVLEYAWRDLGFARIEPADPSKEYLREGWADKVVRWLTQLAELRERFYGVGDAAALRRELEWAQETDVKEGTRKIDWDKHLPRLEGKLKEFQQWWAEHRNDPVILPTPAITPVSTPLTPDYS